MFGCASSINISPLTGLESPKLIREGGSRGYQLPEYSMKLHQSGPGEAHCEGLYHSILAMTTRKMKNLLLLRLSHGLTQIDTDTGN